MTGKVIEIFISPKAAMPMQSETKIMLEAGRGIVDDRYYLAEGTFSEKLKGMPDSHVTLIESENINAFNAESGQSYSFGEFRRNIITKGIDLNSLVGKQFQIGETVLEGIRLCEPCSHLAGLLVDEVLPKMVHKAGLRAKIITGGKIKQDDPIT